MGRQGCSACKFPIELASSERVGFRDTCSSCRSDLHTCHNCAHHDPSAYNECRESSSERVGDRERANRCDYFAIGNAPAGAADESQQQTKNALDDLFKKS
jgi:hypothetical protein